MFHLHTKKHSTHKKDSEGYVFSVMALIKGIGHAAFWTVFPLVLNAMLKSEKLVGYYYSSLSVISLLVALLSTYLFLKYSKVWITKITLSLSIISLVGMTVAKNIWELGGLDIPRAICVSIAGVALSLFVAEYSKKTNLAENEGRFYFYANIGWLIGPILGGYCAKFFGNESVFILTSVLYLIALILFSHQHLVVKHPHITHDKHEEDIFKITKNLKSFLKDVELRKVFIVALGLNFWWAISNIYIPISVENLGFSQDIVGFVIAGGILPLVLFETWVGKQADKKGIKKFVFWGFVILALFSILFPALYKYPLALLISFGAVNIGAALIEPLQETYFFKVVARKNRERFFGIYNTADPIANIFGPIIGSMLILSKDNMDIMWIGTGIILLLFAKQALKIKV